MLSQHNPPLTNSEDVDYNRTGRVSPAQVARYAARKRGHPWVFLLIFFFLVAIFVFLALAATQSGEDPTGYWVAALMIVGIFTLILIPIVVELAWKQKVKRELTEGRVEMVDGQVIWKRSRLTTQAPDHRLKPIYSDTLNLAPGSYRFYFLPESGGLLSAESLGISDQSASRRELIGILAKANHFEPAWLELNRAGNLAPGQKRRLILLSTWFYLLGLFILGSFVYGFIQPLQDNLQDPGSLIFPGLLLVAILAGAGYVAWQGLRTVRDAMAGKVSSIQGRVYKTMHSGRSTTFYYVLDNLNWIVSRTAYNALVEGEPYRVYYVPLSRRLVAIEPL